MGFFSTPAGYKPADSMTIALAAAGAVAVVYSSTIGPAADVQASISGDPSVNSSIKKAGWEALALVTVMTVLSRDLNVAILGYGAILVEHTKYLHSELASPATGQIQAQPAAYAAAGGGAALATALPAAA